MRVDARLTRTGVFPYVQPDGSVVKEYRPPEEVFHADSLNSLHLCAVTDNHPRSGLVTEKNFQSLTIGAVGQDVRQDDEFVVSSMAINHGPAQEKIRNGKVQTSCGYETKIDKTPGTSPEGERYDQIQRKIRYNHVAVVEMGRAGADVRIRMDDGAAMMKTDGVKPIYETEKPTMDPDHKKALEDNIKLQARVDALTAELATANTRADTAEAATVNAKEELTTSEKQRTDADDAFNQKVQDRVQLQVEAEKVLGEDFKTDMTDKAIMVAVVNKVNTKEVRADASDDLIKGLYIGALERAAEGTDALTDLRKAGGSRADSETPDNGREKFLNSRSNMHVAATA